MRGVVGVTDNRWASFLHARPWLSEVNFWLPSARSSFKALSAGEPFLFKTHWPHNRLVGGGFFSGYAVFSIEEAWDLFGEGNGVASMGDLAERIARYRNEPPSLGMQIGSVLLRDTFFVDEEATLPGPFDFAKNIVTYKTYDLAAASHVEAALQELLSNSAPVSEDQPLGVDGPTKGLPRMTVPRVGQQAFKGLLLNSYHRRCAITGAKIIPTLDAAHIRSVEHGGEHRLDNGLLLRTDVHRLFDAGYLGIDLQHRLMVSPSLRRKFGNGEEFYSKQGTVIELPERRVDRPSVEAVTWHLDEVFRSA